MIRSVLAFFVFAVVICATIILQSDRGTGGGPGVSPAAEVATTPEIEPAPAPAVTRAASPTEVAPMGMSTTNSRIALPAGSQIAAEPAIRTDTALTMEDMTNNVLAELGLLEPEASTLPEQEIQRDVTASALAGIGAITGQSAELGQREDLQSLVVAALRAGQDDTTIDSLVNTAAAEGRVAVPEVLVTSDGRVDTSTLLSNIVVQARVAAGQAAPPARPERLADATGLDVRVIQAVEGTTEARFYTVQRGDSLGAISIKFYGNVSGYQTIYQANRQTLTSPDMIRVGQRLIIPDT